MSTALAAAPSFDELVARHERDVLRVCRSILRDEHLSLDAAQETFVHLWTRWSGGWRPDHAGGWLRKVALTVSLDQLRRRRSARADDARPLDSAELPHAAPAADTLDLDELRRRYEAALPELPEGQRTVFLLRHEGGLPLAEVAETLGVALPTVKTQFARACLKLQSRLRPYSPDGTDR